jgi:hypothetical protein
MLATILCALALSTGAPIGLSSNTLQTYERAVQAAREREPMLALAIVESLLMVRPVTVGPDPTWSEHVSPELAEGVRRGLGAWAVVSDSPFSAAAPGTTPDIVVRLASSLPVSGHLQGLLQAQRDYRWNRATRHYQLTGVIYVQRHTAGRVLMRDEIATVVAHELGHLFGLDDHGDHRFLMGPFVSGKVNPHPTRPELERVLGHRAFLREQRDRLERSLVASAHPGRIRSLSLAKTVACRRCR